MSHKRPASRRATTIPEPPKKSKLLEVIEENEDSNEIVLLEDNKDKAAPEKEDNSLEVIPEKEDSTISEDNEEEAPELEREEVEDVGKIEEEGTVELTDEEFRKKEKKELLELFGKCEQLGGPDFEANHERVLIELDKQKDTIKNLLDEIKLWKSQQKTYNMQTILKKATTTTASKKTKSKH